MSGTSLDGLDVVEVEFTQSSSGWSFQLCESAQFNFPDALLQQLSNADKQDGAGLVQADLEFSKFCIQSINSFRDSFQSRAAFISSHGHTVFHEPGRGITLQIGSGAIISTLTGLTTICDFRSQDVALGGQGAPLVPFADSLLFDEYDLTLNLGGFANLSSLQTPLIGFDLCPCNMLLNHLSAELGHSYDSEGSLAREGSINPELLEKLNSINYYRLPPPKSLGKEWFENTILPLLSNAQMNDWKSLLATCTEHIATVIGNSLKGDKSCLITGGGAFNTFLIERIRHHSGAAITLPDAEIIEYKEAIDFTFLGLLRLLESQNVSNTVTGAKKSSVSGAVYLAE